MTRSIAGVVPCSVVVVSALCADVEPQALRYSKLGHYRYGMELFNLFG